MRCANCHNDVPPNQTYCPVCGAQLNLTFDRVTTATGAQIEKEEIRETRTAVEHLLVYAAVFMTIAILLYSIYSGAPSAYAVPVFPHRDAKVELSASGKEKQEEKREQANTLAPFDETKFLNPLRRPY